MMSLERLREMLPMLVFVIGLADMDHFFNLYKMYDAHRIQFAKINCKSQPKTFWTSLERENDKEHIETWV